MFNLIQISIWSKTAIPAEEWKYRNVKRVLFPLIDFILFLGGFSAAYFGVPAISEFFPRAIVDTFSTLLSVAALLAFIGVVFPRLWGLEIVANAIVLGLTVGYYVALVILTVNGQGRGGFILAIASIALAVIIWRLSMLGDEWQERRVFSAHKVGNEDD